MKRGHVRSVYHYDHVDVLSLVMHKPARRMLGTAVVAGSKGWKYIVAAVIEALHGEHEACFESDECKWWLLYDDVAKQHSTNDTNH